MKMCPDFDQKVANLKAIQRTTTKCAGSPKRALEQMASAADALATALRVRPSLVLAYVGDQLANLAARERGAS